LLICLKSDIQHRRRTQIQMVKNMWEILALGLWTTFVIYVTWYCTSAKYNAPISQNEAKLLWKIHRQNKKCAARRWREIKHQSRIVGFECECGHKYMQKRPVVASPPTLQVDKHIVPHDRLRNPRQPIKLQHE